ncbi:MAG: cytochrome C peroxidase [Lewinellaceae bacterium]|nr:cytochrome C peroxidase [Lewinellaceae bacterium]
MTRLIPFLAALVLIGACNKDPLGDLEHIPYAPQPYSMPEMPYFFPEMEIPADNPQTVDGVALGRYLFYDPILSADSTIACASCHRQEYAFSNHLEVAVGIEGRLGTRNVPSLVNVGYMSKGLLWDGRRKSVETLVLHTIPDPVEMDFTVEGVVARLKNHPDYPERFRKAFGIKETGDISGELIGQAIAQFVRTLVSYQSKYDYANWDRGAETQFFSESELRGKLLFTTEPSIDPFSPHPGCSHCHNNTALLTTNEFLNNGINPALAPADFPDPGLGGITNKPIDYGRFKVPTLRNIEMTAPYMHDGRFKTLEEVLNHYSSGGHYSYNVDPNIIAFPMSEQDKQDLIAFLKSMTDEKFLQENAFGNPF